MPDPYETRWRALLQALTAADPLALLAAGAPADELEMEAREIARRSITTGWDAAALEPVIAAVLEEYLNVVVAPEEAAAIADRARAAIPAAGD
jgi:hypothetical protein